MTKLIEQAQEHRHLLLGLLTIIIPLGIVVFAVARNQSSDPVETTTANWTISAHANIRSEAFNHWNDDDPPLIPADCATCHSTHGLLDYVGTHGRSAGTVSEDKPVGTVVTCVACHNDPVHEMQTVAFPSGAEVQTLGEETPCHICHQGTESGVGVREAIAGLEDDVVYDDLEYMDAHYKVAAATLHGGDVQGGYEYAEMSYVGRFDHTAGFQSCDSCHDPHRLTVELLACSTCHVDVQGYDDLRAIRRDNTDYDGDGDTGEGIATEVATYHELLYEAIVTYADEVIGTPIVYSADNHPYFFTDVSEGGEVDPADNLNFENRYQEWTPRLVRAAYNYQFVQFDPGSYAHNPRYTLQLLYDTLLDMNERVPVDMERLQRP